MVYNVEMTERAKEQLDAFVRYLVLDLKNPQAASNLLDDAVDTEESLAFVAGSIPYCSEPDLQKREIRKIHFTKHRYLWLYRVEDDTAYVMAMYYELQDYENIFKRGL